MGEIINAKADPARIEEHVRAALRDARARGEAIAEAADSRLASAVKAMDAALTVRRSAGDAEAAAWAAVLAEDARSDVGVGSVRDAMWNALGRPRQSPHLDEVFPGGLVTYTAGDPRGQPVLMQILRSRIQSASAPQWTEPLRAGWSAQVESLRAGYETAVETHRPAEAAATVAEAGYRAAVRAAQARLAAFKRDLKNLGLTESQIHDIIPDASTGGGGGGGGGGAGVSAEAGGASGGSSAGPG